jgi:hypothetical protein
MQSLKAGTSNGNILTHEEENLLLQIMKSGTLLPPELLNKEIG